MLRATSSSADLLRDLNEPAAGILLFCEAQRDAIVSRWYEVVREQPGLREISFNRGLPAALQRMLDQFLVLLKGEFNGTVGWTGRPLAAELSAGRRLSPLRYMELLLRLQDTLANLFALRNDRSDRLFARRSSAGRKVDRAFSVLLHRELQAFLETRAADSCVDELWRSERARSGCGGFSRGLSRRSEEDFRKIPAFAGY